MYADVLVRVHSQTILEVGTFFYKTTNVMIFGLSLFPIGYRIKGSLFDATGLAVRLKQVTRIRSNNTRTDSWQLQPIVDHLRTRRIVLGKKKAVLRIRRVFRAKFFLREVLSSQSRCFLQVQTFSMFTD